MNSILKLAVTLAVFLAMAMPAMASEQKNEPVKVNKGSKSYQSKTFDSNTNSSTQSTNAQDVSDIAPAAGGEMMEFETGRALKDTLHLPRKN
jgi:predicted lipid-binding transport protein (Tim44 family)